MAKSGRPSSITFLTVTVFIGAFLLFSMEPYAGRILAPAFGGSVQVWLVCLTFFQLMLLAGYACAYLLAGTAGGFFPLLLILPAAALPFAPLEAMATDGSISALIAMLMTRFALPFTVLSATAVAAQIRLSRSGSPVNPYPLYSASNAGSLAALIALSFYYRTAGRAQGAGCGVDNPVCFLCGTGYCVLEQAETGHAVRS